MAYRFAKALVDPSPARLLILAGSEDVTPGDTRRAALNHFDGPEFRLVRKYYQDARPGETDTLQIMVLTDAGLIGAFDVVDPSAAGMDGEAAARLKCSTVSMRVLQQGLDGADAVFAMCGAEEEDAISHLMLSRAGGAADWMRVKFARGGQARRLNDLLRWLVASTPGDEDRAAIVRAAAIAVECATDRPLSRAAQSVLDGYLDDLAQIRAEIDARNLLAAE